MDQAKREKILEQGEYLFDEAVKYSQLGVFSNAMQYLDRAEHQFFLVRDMHKLADLWYERMAALIRKENFEDALNINDRVTRAYYQNKNFSGLVKVFLLNAQIYEKKEEYLSAAEKALHALVLDENENEGKSKKEIHPYLVRCYSRLGMHYESNEVIQRALKLIEEDTIEHAWFHEKMADNYYAYYEFEKAEFSYTVSYETYLHHEKYNEASRVMNVLLNYYEENGLTQKIYDMKHKMVNVNQVVISKPEFH